MFGMVVTNAQARLIAADGPISVTATITNATGADDWLVGGSSPAASTGGIYATCACGTDAVTGLAGKSAMPSWLIVSTTAIDLRPGDGEMLLMGMTQPVSVGQTISVTFKFTHAPPATVDVVVASSLG
jgi:copper(I)-binding protein